ncbi:hypothetical protein J0H58_10990 [bacterium]|nr:hypothetical protein [bacterium]
MWRQGDAYIATAAEVPAGARPLPHRTLAEGEMTGHSHRVAEAVGSALYAHGASLYLVVSAERVTVVHDEHGPIPLPRGTYRVWQQREYSPEAIRTVRD